MTLKIKKFEHYDKLGFSSVSPSDLPFFLLTCGSYYERTIRTPYGKIPHPNELVRFIRENKENLSHILQKIAKRNKLDLQLSHIEIPFSLEDIPVRPFGDEVSVEILPVNVVVRIFEFLTHHAATTEVWGNLFSRLFVYFPEFLTPSRPYRRLYYSSVNPERVRLLYMNRSNVKLVAIPIAKTYRNIITIGSDSKHEMIVRSYFADIPQTKRSSILFEITVPSDGNWNVVLEILDRKAPPTKKIYHTLSNLPPEVEKLLDIMATTTLVNFLSILLSPPKKVSLYSDLGRYTFVKLSLFVRSLYKNNVKRLIDSLKILASLTH